MRPVERACTQGRVAKSGAAPARVGRMGTVNSDNSDFGMRSPELG